MMRVIDVRMFAFGARAALQADLRLGLPQGVGELVQAKRSTPLRSELDGTYSNANGSPSRTFQLRFEAELSASTLLYSFSSVVT